MNPPDFEVRRDQFPSTLFPPHGRYSARVVGNIIFMEASGPFNLEFMRAYLKVTHPVERMLASRGPFGCLVHFYDSMLMSVETVAELAASQRNWSASKWENPVAYVADPSVEGRNLMIPLIARTVFEPDGTPFRAFEQTAPALAWLQESLV